MRPTVSALLRRSVPGLFLVLGMALGVTPAMAQPDRAEAAPGANAGRAIQQTQQEIQQLSAQLQEIQKKTLEANPELKAQSENFQALLDEEMSANGFEAGEARDRLETIRDEVKNGEVDPQEKQELAQEFQTKRQELGQARREAMSNEDVKQARAALNKDLVAAMTEQDPNTQQLLTRLNKANQQYRQMLKQMLRQQTSSAQDG